MSLANFERAVDRTGAFLLLVIGLIAGGALAVIQL